MPKKFFIASFLNKSLYTAIMERSWICPSCLSNEVVHRYEVQTNRKGDVVIDSDDMDDYYFHCRNCGYDFDNFEIYNDIDEYKLCIDKGEILK